MEGKYWWWIGGGAVAMVGIGTGAYLLTRKTSTPGTVPNTTPSATFSTTSSITPSTISNTVSKVSTATSSIPLSVISSASTSPTTTTPQSICVVPIQQLPQVFVNNASDISNNASALKLMQTFAAAGFSQDCIRGYQTVNGIDVPVNKCYTPTFYPDGTPVRLINAQIPGVAAGPEYSLIVGCGAIPLSIVGPAGTTYTVIGQTLVAAQANRLASAITAAKSLIGPRYNPVTKQLVDNVTGSGVLGYTFHQHATVSLENNYGGYQVTVFPGVTLYDIYAMTPPLGWIALAQRQGATVTIAAHFGTASSTLPTNTLPTNLRFLA